MMKTQQERLGRCAWGFHIGMFWILLIGLGTLIGMNSDGEEYGIGFPDRDPQMDVLPGFQNPPPGYGEVAFYWWLGDPLTRERLAWQIDQLSDMGVMGLQVNYAHSDQGGYIYGLTFPSDPPLFSSDWWDLFGWFLQEAKQHGMSVSLSDYTLGVGQGWYMDEILKDHPDLQGMTLGHESKMLKEGQSWNLPDNTLCLKAYRLENGILVPESGIDVLPYVTDRTLQWSPPYSDEWQGVAVYFSVNPHSVDPLNPKLGEQVIEKFFQRFADHNPGEEGKGLNFFFSDELEFGVRGNLWTARFAQEFQNQKGYDLIPLLPALFVDIGAQTPKIRLDYRDVMVSMEEDGYFKPVFEWHNQHGMIYGCDHGGRGLQVDEFGDYYRTQRWMTGPGCDQPNLSAHIIKNKVASSIAHLYERPRTWLEGYHSSGWGTSLEQLTDTTLRNFTMGQNLLTLHGLYYSTHGGWWEWAPPCNHFRMPYWHHMGEYMNMVQRLGYLLSQGHHRCDVAVLYPVAALEAGMGGEDAVKAAFGLGEFLYERGCDFDFIDFQSVERAEIQNRQLAVSGEVYKVLVLPAMRALRFSTLQKAAEFYRQGGIVVSLGALPEASDRIGREDAELDALVKEIFGISAKETSSMGEVLKHTNEKGGMGLIAQTSEQVLMEIAHAFLRDFVPASENVDIMHRRIGTREVYMVYGAQKNSECFFRAKGQVERWDPWSGSTYPVLTYKQTDDGTVVKMPLEAKEAQIIVFRPAPADVSDELSVEQTNLVDVVDIRSEQNTLSVRGIADSAGEKTALVNVNGRKITLQGIAKEPLPAISIDGDWRFELQPTMDNQWGDFRWPPFPGMIGAEARRFRYEQETSSSSNYRDPKFDDSSWPMVTASFGPQFWKLGPLPETADPAELEKNLLALSSVDPSVPVVFDGKTYSWTPYEFSWRWGIENDPGHQGYHGLKEEVHEEFIGLGKMKQEWTIINYEKDENGNRYYLWSSVVSPRDGSAYLLTGGIHPAQMWINQQPCDPSVGSVSLRQGANPLLLRYDTPGRGYVVFDTESPAIDETVPTPKYKPMKMKWFEKPGILAFDALPQLAEPAGWYRFLSPPALQSMTFTAQGEIQVWVDGQEAALEEIEKSSSIGQTYKATVLHPQSGSSVVAIRIRQERGGYGGAAISDPIALQCAEGNIALGDWSKCDGLASYSGGAWYRKTFSLTPDRVAGRAILDLGHVVTTAEVWINGKKVGTRVAPPWQFDVSSFIQSGENLVEVLVYNTLANHYLTIPTRYRGSMVSGLLGPVTIRTDEWITLKTAQ